MRQVIIYSGEDGYFVAECPSLPGCVSQGKTLTDSMRFYCLGALINLFLFIIIIPGVYAVAPKDFICVSQDCGSGFGTVGFMAAPHISFMGRTYKISEVQYEGEIKNSRIPQGWSTLIGSLDSDDFPLNKWQTLSESCKSCEDEKLLEKTKSLVSQMIEKNLNFKKSKTNEE